MGRYGGGRCRCTRGEDVSRAFSAGVWLVHAREDPWWPRRSAAVNGSLAPFDAPRTAVVLDHCAACVASATSSLRAVKAGGDGPPRAMQLRSDIRHARGHETTVKSSSCILHCISPGLSRSERRLCMQSSAARCCVSAQYLGETARDGAGTCSARRPHADHRTTENHPSPIDFVAPPRLPLCPGAVQPSAHAFTLWLRVATARVRVAAGSAPRAWWHQAPSCRVHCSLCRF